ncbi:MAG: hypothetical protein ACTHU0_18340 [Kofleriaceae bacterium]
MKVYVAASSGEIQRAKGWISRLVAAGVQVTSTWPETIAAVGDANPRDASPGQRLAWAVADLHQVASADLLWMMAPVKEAGRGAYVELGFAHAQRKLLVVSGCSWQSIFGALAREFETDEEAFAFIVEEASRG